MGSSDVDQDQPGWEYLLYISELEDGLAAHDGAWNDFEAGVAHPSAEPVLDPKAAFAGVTERSAEIARTVARIEPFFAPAKLELAFGAPGEPGDQSQIRLLAGEVIEVYRAMLDWAAETRGATVPDEFKWVYWALSNYVRLPSKQIREFVADLVARARPAIEALQTEPEPQTPVALKFSLDLDVDPLDIAEFTTALHALE